MTLSVGTLKCTDGYQFMSFSFERLTECLKSKTGDTYEKITSVSRSFSDEEMALIDRKSFTPTSS